MWVANGRQIDTLGVLGGPVWPPRGLLFISRVVGARPGCQYLAVVLQTFARTGFPRSTRSLLAGLVRKGHNGSMAATGETCVPRDLLVRERQPVFNTLLQGALNVFFVRVRPPVLDILLGTFKDVQGRALVSQTGI